MSSELNRGGLDLASSVLASMVPGGVTQQEEVQIREAAAKIVKAYEIGVKQGSQQPVTASTDAPQPDTAKLLQLVLDLTDPGCCSFDHHGGCQEHGYLTLSPGEKCPHQEAKDTLSKFWPEGYEALGVGK